MYLKQHTVCTRTIHFSFFDFVEHVSKQTCSQKCFKSTKSCWIVPNVRVADKISAIYINNWKSVVGPNSFMVQKIASQFRQQPSQSRKQPHSSDNSRQSPENSLIVQKIASQSRNSLIAQKIAIIGQQHAGNMVIRGDIFVVLNSELKPFSFIKRSHLKLTRSRCGPLQ